VEKEEWQVFEGLDGAAQRGGKSNHSACSLLPGAGPMRMNESVP